MRSTLRYLAIVPIVLLMAAPVSADVTCQYGEWRTITYSEDYGLLYCGGYGVGCTECVNTQSGGSCLATGNEYCEPQPLHQDP